MCDNCNLTTFNLFRMFLININKYKKKMMSLTIDSESDQQTQKNGKEQEWKGGG